MSNDTSSNIKKSISSIYSSIMETRKEKNNIKKEKKRQSKEEKKLAKQNEDGTVINKKEKRDNNVNEWKNIIVGLTGEDLDYVSTKKSKKKYKKWISDDLENSGISTAKPAKKKKKNYNKEFEPEINMLKNIVADQNKFTLDLLRRYQIAAGPNTKDAMPLNKTLVELAAVINNSRSNSLGILREIGNLKKTIADLYLKQRKEDRETGTDGFVNQDLGLLGSDIVKSTFGNSIFNESNTSNVNNIINNNPVSTNIIEKFDPSTWGGANIDIGATIYETIPHQVVVEWHKNDNKARYVAIRNDDGSELLGCPVPTARVKSINESNNTASDDFDQVYPLKIIE